MTKTEQTTAHRRGHKKSNRWTLAPSLGKKNVQVESAEESAVAQAVHSSDRITTRRPAPQTQPLVGPVGLVRGASGRCVDHHPAR